MGMYAPEFKVMLTIENRNVPTAGLILLCLKKVKKADEIYTVNGCKVFDILYYIFQTKMVYLNI